MQACSVHGLCTPLCTTLVDRGRDRQARHTVVARSPGEDRWGTGTLWRMSSSLSNLFAAAEAPKRELPMPPVAFGLLMFLGFMVLLGVLWFFRGAAQNVAGPTALGDQQGSHH